jgi:hypothetical protein
LRPGNNVTDLEHQPISAGVQHEAHLIGVWANRSWCDRRQAGSCQLDQVVGLAACTIPGVVKPFGVATLDVRDEVTDIQTLAGRFDPCAYPPLPAERQGLRNSGVISSQTLRLISKHYTFWGW